MMTSTPQLPKAKRSVVRLIVVTVLAVGSLFLVTDRQDKLRGPSPLRANAVAVAEVDGSEHRQLARHWFKDTRPNKKTWRRNKWPWYNKQRKKHGSKVKYVKKRPGWVAHPNKAKRRDGSLASKATTTAATISSECANNCVSGAGCAGDGYCDEAETEADCIANEQWCPACPNEFVEQSASYSGFWEVASLSSNLNQFLSAFPDA